MKNHRDIALGGFKLINDFITDANGACTDLLKSGNHARRQYAERTAINAPMQGTAADIIKRAMLAVDSWIQAADTDIRMIMQVHDELVLEVPEDRLEPVSIKLTGLMQQAAQLKVPLVVEVGVGENWALAH